MKQTMELFISYSHVDEEYKEELESHLHTLEKDGLVVSWNFRKISPGKDWAQEIDAHLKTAQIILLLVSRNFLKSDYCNGIEVKKAMQKHESGEARIIPVVLETVHPSDWKGAPYSKLQALPDPANPVLQWPDRTKAYESVIAGILKVVEELSLQTTERLKEAVETAATAEAVEKSDGSAPKIIIIEDDSRWLQRTQTMLDAQHFRTETYDRYSDELLLRLTKDDYDLLIIDLNLDSLESSKQGKNLAQLARESNKNLPIIVISGVGDMYDVKEAYSDLKIHDFIFKQQWNPTSFLLAVKSALQLKHSNDGGSK